ncbi:MAG TPA: sugar ABC transporter permease [Gaiellaceae bacterium]|nr:sugar ABC transporter permease [Gaiellaceae bacterium]
MTEGAQAIPDIAIREVAMTKVKEPRARAKLKDTWWRHAVGIIGIVVSLFPVVYVISSAFNRDNTLQGASLIPVHVTTNNFTNLLRNHVADTSGGYSDAPYLHWVLNSMIVAGCTAIFTTLLGALAAYAFSRFRFKGRRMGMLTLLLIQMFPQFAAVAAIYLLVYNLGHVFGVLGLNSLLAVIVVYLGGSMGVQAWLMKGFFDTIPTELDESARVDGATPAQIFWGVVLPLAAPVLVVVALISFVFTLNEFVIASALLQTNKHFTLPVGLYGFINQNYGQHWGPFAAGSLMAMIPVTALFLFLQRWIVSGLTAGSVKG